MFGRQTGIGGMLNIAGPAALTFVQCYGIIQSMRVEDLPEVNTWFESALDRQASHKVYARFSKAVIWTDKRNPDGTLVVPANSESLVEEIQNCGYALHWGHDPGHPVGRLVAASRFVAPDGVVFVVALVGFYGASTVSTFGDLGLDTGPQVAQPHELPDLAPETRIDFFVDQREVTSDWLADVGTESSLPIRHIELSHNATEALTELIRIGIPYVLLVWNPFVKSFASEAGKAAYAGFHSWLTQLWLKLRGLRDPIVTLEASQFGCQVSYIFRGKDPNVHNAAHDKLSLAAAQAASLISAISARGLVPTLLIYEFSGERWYPSHVTLSDGRLIVESAALIALERERGNYSLSLGFRVDSMRVE